MFNKPYIKSQKKIMENRMNWTHIYLNLFLKSLPIKYKWWLTKRTERRGYNSGGVWPWPSTHPQSCRRARGPFWSNWTRGPDSVLQSEDSTVLWKQRNMACWEAQCPHRPAHETRRAQGRDLTLTPGGPQTSTPHLPLRSPQWNWLKQRIWREARQKII